MNAPPSLSVLAAAALAGALLAGCASPAGSPYAAATADAYRQTRPGELTGSVSWLQRLLPPPGTELVVQLVDVTRPGAPAVLVKGGHLAFTSDHPAIDVLTVASRR